jgi:hypothetical protein
MRFMVILGKVRRGLAMLGPVGHVRHLYDMLSQIRTGWITLGIGHVRLCWDTLGHVRPEYAKL